VRDPLEDWIRKDAALAGTYYSRGFSIRGHATALRGVRRAV